MEEKTLSPKRARFVSEYLKDQNGVQAAIRAGYSQASAQEQSTSLLSFPAVKKAVEEGFRRISEENGITTQKVISELAKIALSDIGNLFKVDGTLKDIKDIPEEFRRAVASVEIVELFEGSGADRKQIGVTKKIKPWDKVKALELLAKNLGLLVERHQVEGNGFTLRQIIPEKTETAS